MKYSNEKCYNQAMDTRKYTKILLLTAVCFSFLKPDVVAADFYFDTDYIISDEEMNDFNSLSKFEIQRFLEKKGGALATLILPDYNGEQKKASEIIWQAAQENNISPKVLLVTLQKEQSLISSKAPTQNQLDKAMGYRCPDGALCHPAALGFGKQVDGAAWQFRQYMDNPSRWNFRAGQTYLVDNVYTVIPQTQATAGLYNYTPHYSGNYRFWQLWQSYFGVTYPEGSLVKAEGQSGVWLIQYGARRLITSYSILLSRFDPKRILPISISDLEKYKIGPEIKFHNYSLLRAPDGAIYLLVDDELRHIVSWDVFKGLGFNIEEVQQVNDADLEGYTTGSTITLESAYPQGMLVQDSVSHGVYFVDNGIKYPIFSAEIMRANFSDKPLIQKTQDELDRYPIGDPVKFKDGVLVKSQSNPEVYVISNGERRWIKTEDAFAKFGYRWDNIITTTEQAVFLHQLGDDIE